MRQDVKKVVAERPKSNRTWQSKTPRIKYVWMDTAGDQSNEESNKILLKKQKWRRLRFNILERFLINNVGRPWDKVFAEACQVTDSRSLQGAEIREQLKDLVATECWQESRAILSYDCRGTPRPVEGLYVHPKTGLLPEAPKLTRFVRASRQPRSAIDVKL